MAGKRKIETGRTGARTASRRGQIARLTVMDCDTGGTEVVLETGALIEAPNWTPDGRFLIVNEGGSWAPDSRRFAYVAYPIVD
jgi:Tol biopolymer transport system component